MKKKRIASALLSGAMLMSMCCFGASAADSEHPDIIFGDLNLDSSVNLLDAITSQKYVINSVTLDSITAVDESLLDINQDGKTNLLDTIALQKHLINTDVKDYIGKIAYEWITEEQEHTEEILSYENIFTAVCNDCGIILSGYDSEALDLHMFGHMDGTLPYNHKPIRYYKASKGVTIICGPEDEEYSDDFPIYGSGCYGSWGERGVWFKVEFTSQGDKEYLPILDENQLFDYDFIEMLDAISAGPGCGDNEVHQPGDLYWKGSEYTSGKIFTCIEIPEKGYYEKQLAT